MELRKQPPENLCQSQETLFVHPPGEMAPLAKDPTTVDVCDFVLQEKDTKPSSKTVVELQSDSVKVSHKPSKKDNAKALSQSIFYLQSDSNVSDTSSKEEDEY
jgi:hypothetical protein